MTTQTDIIKEQLLIKALNSAYLCNDILSGHVKTLFEGDKGSEVIANVLVKYYMQSTEQLTETALKLQVSEKIDKDRELKDIPDEEKQKIYNQVTKICNTPMDDTSATLNALDKYVRQRLSNQVILEIVSKGGQDGDVATPLQDALARINALDITGQGSKAVSVYEDFDIKEKAYNAMNLDKLTMGLRPFDQALNGGLAKGEVGMLGARSGFGKTTYMSNISVAYTKQGYNVFHISLEEKEGQSYLRFDKALLGISNQVVFDANGNVIPNYLAALRKVYTDTNNNPDVKRGDLFFYKGMPQTITISKLKQLVLSTQRLRGLTFDVIMVDYPDLLLNDQSTGNESVDGGRTFERLRALAQELNVVMWTATQLNRGSANKELLTLDDVEGSYRKKNVVEFAATINVNKDERMQGYSRLYIDKLRNNNDYDEDMLFFKFDKTKGQILEESEVDHYTHLSIVQKNDTANKQERKGYYAQEQNTNNRAEGSIL